MGKVQDATSYAELLANLRTYINSIKSSIAQHSTELDGLKSQDRVFAEILGSLKERVIAQDARRDIDELRALIAAQAAEIGVLRQQMRASDQSERVQLLDKQVAVLASEVSSLRERLSASEMRFAVSQPILPSPLPQRPPKRIGKDANVAASKRDA